jgi:hypothetical protein
MDRGSSKHSPRVDDQMADEVRGTVQGIVGARVEEWKMAEPSGEDQPRVGELADDALSRFATYIGRIFPADREAIARNARENEAPDDLLARIDRLPPGQVFANVAEAWRAGTTE